MFLKKMSYFNKTNNDLYSLRETLSCNLADCGKGIQRLWRM